MRPIYISLLCLLILGCAPNKRTIPPGEAMALKAAEKWTESQGITKAAEFSARPDGTGGWNVSIYFQPATPGDHVLIRMDSKGNVIEVMRGA